jgi:formylmethanofuran dehydrogenase subunit C
MITLHPLKEFRFPVVAECISPDIFEKKTTSEIETLKLWEGNKQRTLAELFSVEETGGTDADVTIEGNVGEVREIGTRMTKGFILIKGDAGMHLGKEMEGGRIAVNGNAGAWTGSMMKDGEIEILGDCSDFLAAPYWGTRLGMNGGKITVHGNAGNEVGSCMKNGIIKIHGNAGQFAGFRMYDGTIHVSGNCGARAGACMTDGKIVIGGSVELILSTFAIEGIRAKVKTQEGETIEDEFYVFLGDLTENGKGKVYVSKQKNPQLRQYEKFL